MAFLVVIHGFWRPKKSFSSISYPFSQRCVVQACCHPLKIVLIVRILFTRPEQFRSLFILILWSPSSQYYSFSAFRYHSPNLTGASFKYPLISSWSLRSYVSKSPQVSSFVFQFFPVNCAFATFISNSYGGSFKSSLSWLSYQFVRFFQILPADRWRLFSSLRYIYLNPFYENK